MIAEAGHFALVIATILALMAGIVPPVGLKRHDMGLIALADRFAVAQFLMVAIAFAALMHGFIVSDFSLKVVAANSHTAKPMLYKVAGTWGNHEGSLLLWVLILTLFASLVSLFGRNLPLTFRARVLSVQALLSLGFLLFILVTSNPFERLSPAPLEGNGLNPLLQDPGLAFHPPMLYLGYVGLSVAFSFAVAALIEREVTPMWARWVRPWTLAAWIFLTGGIALGSWWAYYELGWGGWWFWDPVENASFMPWLAASALLHSAIVVEKRDALKSWTILLAIVAFSFSLLGTFLVRSGVITSVHAFAVDPTRGIFILGFLALVVGASLTLFAMRAPSLAPGGLFGLVSRESALVLNNILLATFAAVVLIGTLYPLFVEAAGGAQISVGAPFFNYAALVLMSPLIVALGLGPLLAWKRGRLSRAARILLPALIVAAVVFVGTVWATAGGYVMSAFGLALGLWLIVSAKLEILQRIRFFEGPMAGLKRLVRLPRAALGMALAHMGLGVLVLAITISETWTSETLTVLSPGETAMAGGYEFTLDKVEPVAGPNYAAVRGTLSVRKDGEFVTVLTPEDRTFGDPVMETTEAAIRPLVTGDLYAVIGEAIGPVAADGRWSLRLYFKPAISGLWLGTLMMMAGGLLSLTDRRARVGAAGAREKAA